ncbi:hypothetical protein [Caulobacter sp. NIBR1757]|uniref:hypothetical protein n=1 Tax=Caulobacter sp. NIBR1757 TaxID=3016000 RepID=UPI0022F040AD|nr:hypothetical protein [Caulobacter sp. NIBR1757]WGM41019.1 hypothetical protein AMEJIAPC_03967 [Caulobacter sp. NIBR1757]
MITQWLLDRPWLSSTWQAIGWVLACGVAVVYLNGAHGGFRPFDPLFDWFLARGSLLIGLFGLFALVLVVFHSVDWQGPVPVRGGDGPAWSRSMRSRLGLIGNTPFLAVISYGLFDFAQRMAFASDWARSAVAAYFCLDFLLLTAAGLMMAFSTRQVLGIEADGVRFGKRLLPFSAVERVRVTGDLKDRQVALVEAGRERWLSLETIGVSARTFIDRLKEAAPDLQVDWPIRGEGEA